MHENFGEYLTYENRHLALGDDHATVNLVTATPMAKQHALRSRFSREQEPTKELILDALDIEQAAKTGQHPTARQRATLVTEAIYDITEYQLSNIRQIRGQWRMSPGHVIFQALVAGVGPLNCA